MTQSIFCPMCGAGFIADSAAEIICPSCGHRPAAVASAVIPPETTPVVQGAPPAAFPGGPGAGALSDKRPVPSYFWLLWTLLTSLAMGLLTLFWVFMPWVSFASPMHYVKNAMVWIVIGAVQCVLLGRAGRRLWLWWGLSYVALISADLGISLVLNGPLRCSVLGANLSLVPFLMRLAAVWSIAGTIQLIALRRFTSATGWWIVLSVAAMLLSAMTAGMITQFVTRATCFVHGSELWADFARVLGATMSALVLAVPTGLLLTSLLRGVRSPKLALASDIVCVAGAVVLAAALLWMLLYTSGQSPYATVMCLVFTMMATTHMIYCRCTAVQGGPAQVSQGAFPVPSRHRGWFTVSGIANVLALLLLLAAPWCVWGVMRIDAVEEAWSEKQTGLREEEANDFRGRVRQDGRPELLLRALRSYNYDIVRTAQDGLSERRSPELIDLLIDQFNDDDPYYRLKVIRTFGTMSRAETSARYDPLGRTKGPGGMTNAEIVRRLGEALDSREGRVRIYAAVALTEFHDNRAIGDLIDALEVEGLAQSAARALGRTGQRRAVKPLIRLFDNRSPWVGASAIEAIVQIGGVDAELQLAEVLDNGNAHARQCAAVALAKLDDFRGFDELVDALGCPGLNSSAAAALGESGDWAAVEPLIEALKDDDEHLRRAAARALGDIGDPRAIEPLREAARDKPTWERDVFDRAIERIEAMQRGR